MSGYKKLDAWQHSMQLVKEVYSVTKSFPKEEQYALASQTKRAPVSVPCNIAEGIGRNYKKRHYSVFAHCKGIFVRIRDFAQYRHYG